jgi:PAS domain S-box-containing protein
VTEHKKLLAREAASRVEMIAERKFRELIENAPDAILQVDSMGLVVLANRTAELVFGYSRDELIEMSVDALVPEAARSRQPAHRKGFEATGESRPMGMGLDLCAVRKDGTGVPVEISLSPNRTEGGINITAVIRDVTERKWAEQQIHSLEQSCF